MSPEHIPVVDLTPEELETADFFLEACNLLEFADVQIEMLNQTESVRYGLGRCAKYLGKSTPEEIRKMVLEKIDEQKKST